MKTCVCICTYKRPQMLARLLRSLRDIELDEATCGTVELIIVDNAPTGEARRICDEAAGELPIDLILVEEPQQGLSFARNRALREFLERGADFAAFVDDDDLPEPDWLLRLIENQRETGVDIVYGSWETIQHENLPDWIKKTWLLKPKADSVHRKNIHGVPVVAGTCNVLVSRRVIEILRATGPVFSPEFATIGGEGMDFFIRAMNSGATTALAEKSIVNRDHEADRLTFKGILKRNFHNGHVQMILAIKHCDSKEVKELKKENFAILKKNLTGILKSGLSIKTSANRYMRISYALGRMHASFGGGFDYYK